MWISSEQFSAISGIKLRAAQFALTRASIGDAWHGHTLEVRTFHGRGGRSGIQYQVKVSSLPEHLKDRLKALQITEEAVSRLRLGDDTAQFERAWKYDIIKHALSYPKGSGERKAEIDLLSGAQKLDWTGHYRTLTRSTLYSWIEIYELEGIHGLAQKVRCDKGNKRVFISLAWMNAVPFDDATKASIHQDIKQYVRGLVKGGGQLKQTRILTGEKLKEISAAYGFTSRDERVFAIPQAFVQAEHHFKAVYRHKMDRKASEDNKPRIRRTTANLVPMEIVVMDVHHINVHVMRDDGTYSTPKLIAFHDIATNRVFCELIQFDNRGGVRNADIITAFVNMCQHEAFGVPQFLYVDNGSEYRFADDLEDALKLGANVVPFGNVQERNRIVRAKAYNAAAKHVEGWFRQFNQQYARHIPGWRDDDPMNPKRPQLGKLHDPYPNGFDAFCDEIFNLLTAYEHMPQKGQLKTSPAQAFKKHINDGWKATILNPVQLLTVFTRPEPRVVEKHGISIRNALWTCDGLLEFFGRKVIAHVPKYHGFAALLITDEYGNDIGIAEADKPFNVFDERGAKQSARRTRIRNKAIKELGKIAPNIDVGAELISFGRKHIPVVPNEPDATISVARPGSQRRAILPVPAENQSRMKEEEHLRTENVAARALMAKLTNSRKIS